KEGGCSAAFVGSASRAISQGLRAGIELKEIVKQQVGIQCGNGTWNDGVMIRSCPDAIARTLEVEAERLDGGREEGKTEVKGAPLSAIELTREGRTAIAEMEEERKERVRIEGEVEAERILREEIEAEEESSSGDTKTYG
ncbi:hypothetical protein LCGC14_2463300, partial [marine sediment metagenome]